MRVIVRGSSSEERYPREEIEGPLSEQVERTLKWLKDNLRTVSENVGGRRRRDRCELPERALRELVGNAILHRDYEASGSVRIEITSQEVIITNPGQVNKEIEQAESPFSYRHSHPKNPELLRVLIAQGWAEGQARGFEIIEEAFKKYRLALPKISNLPNGLVQVVIQRPNFSSTASDVLSKDTDIVIRAGNHSSIVNDVLSRDTNSVIRASNQPILISIDPQSSQSQTVQLTMQVLPSDDQRLLDPQPNLGQPNKTNTGFVRTIRSRWNRSPFWTKIVTAVVIFGLLLSSFWYVPKLFTGNPSVTGTPAIRTPTPPSFPDGIGVFKAPNGDMIGISDGRYPFDTDRPDGPSKLQAASAFLQRNTGAALASWQAAMAQDPGDGEAPIYLEDQQVLDSGNPYLNIVLGVSMAGGPLYNSRDVLQGAYVAQHDYNQTHEVKVRLLLASAGSDPLYATTVAQQILQVAKADSHTIAVMGWTNSSRTLNAEPLLVQAPLVMLSQNASSSLLTGISPYFFHIVPPSRVQAEVGAVYAKGTLHAQNIAVFVDPTDAYGEDIEPKFVSKFTAEGGKIVASEIYNMGHTSNFPSLLADALKHNPDLIYFPGSSPDISAFLGILPTTGKFSTLRVLAGNGGGGVAVISHVGYDRLIYTASADSSAWSVAGLGRPPFLDEYSRTFSVNTSQTAESSLLPDAYAVVSYDGTQTLLTGIQTTLEGGKSAITPSDLRDALTHITGSQSLQGVSGQISFDTHHDPTQKPVFIVQGRKDGSSYLVPNGIQGGCYVKGCV